jgi:predicted Rossmann fold flavoprotein
MKTLDAIILGAGAYGLMTAVIAGRRGKRVLILERNEQAGKKILISGGGRCNYTNLYTKADNFISDNPRFIHNILSRWSVQDTLDFFGEYGIEPQEKTLGQLFPVSNKAKDFRDGMLNEALRLGGEILYGVRVEQVEHSDETYRVTDQEGTVWSAPALVVATGGKTIPAMGATDYGLKLAGQFGLTCIPDAPALVPFAAAEQDAALCESLAGLAIEASASIRKQMFREQILFTHKGWSGPAILQISSYWNPGQIVLLDLLPDVPEDEILTGKGIAAQSFKEYLPSRWVQHLVVKFPFLVKNIQEIGRKDRDRVIQFLKRFEVHPEDTLGYAKAEVMRGGVDTRGLIPKTLEARTVPGLYFGGEVTDVTGWLGGYNFQWAWACGVVTGNAI